MGKSKINTLKTALIILFLFNNCYATIQGSSLEANENIDITATNTDIIASKDNYDQSEDTQHQHLNVSIGSSGFSMSASADKVNGEAREGALGYSSESTTNATNNANTKLQANNITINTTETTNVIGANVNAVETLTLNTKNLNVESVQDTSKTREHSMGISAGYGGGSLSSAGANMSKGNSKVKETIQTDLTGNEVNINVQEHTKLRGATIASVDKVNSEDNGNLNFKTDTLTASSLNNTNNSKSMSVGINAGGAVEDAEISNVGLDFSSDRTNSKTKTLATLGNGNIQIGNVEDSDTKMLNRDVANNEVDIYDISSHKGLKGELDTRLLTEDGRNQIKEDLTKSSFIATSLIEAATQESSSLVGDRASGETGFFENVENKVDLLEGTKKFVNDPANEKARDVLLNPDASPEEIQQANQQLHIYVAKEMGIKPAELELILDQQYKGFTSSEDGKARVAANLHNTMGDMANTTLNETSDVADLQRDAGVVKNDSYVGNRDEYSTNFGNLGQDLLNNQYSQATGSSINNVAYNKKGTDLNRPSELNQRVVTNTQTFNKLDKSKGAHRQLKTKEIEFVKENATEYAKQKYKTDSPTSEQLQGAEHELAQEALRQVDVVWNVVLGEENTQAKEFLQANAQGETFTNSRGEEQELLTTKNGDFYDPTRYADEASSTNTDIYQVAQAKAKETLSNPEQLQERIKDKVKEELTLENIIEKGNDFIDESKKKSLADLAKDKFVDIATSGVDGIETVHGISEASNETLDKIYGEGATATIEGVTTVLAIGSVIGNGKKGSKTFTKETIEAPSGKKYNFYGQDIDLDLEFENPRTGKIETNREWMKRGNNPYILDKNGKAEPTQQHHSQQNANGPIFEVQTTTHQNSNNQQVLHPYDKDGTGKNPNNPVDHKEWNKDRTFINKERVKNLESEENN